MDALDALAQTPIFRGGTRPSLEQIASSLHRKVIRKGGFAWLEQSAATVVYVVEAGRIECSRTSPSGEHIVVEYYGPGEVGGLPGALIDGATRMTQGKALEETVVLGLEREALFALLEREPTVMRRVLDNVARAARVELHAFSDVAFLDLRSRVANKLFDLAAQHGEPSKDGDTISVKVSQRSLAAMVAASREKVNRALARLSAEGVIRQDPGRITVLIPERVRKRS